MINLALLLIWILSSTTHALSLKYCSKTNLGSGSSPLINEFMSNGLCHDNCLGQNFAVAIVSGTDCYCSDDVPGDTVSMTNCNIGCPGYSEQENCAGNNYYGYIILSNPSSTVSKGQPTDDSSSNQDEDKTVGTTLITQTTQVTKVHETSDIVKVTMIVSTTPATSSSATSTSSSSVVIEPSTVYSIVTVNGNTSQTVKTLYITHTPSDVASPSSTANDSSSIGLHAQTSVSTENASSTSNSPEEKSTFFDNKGKVAGTFTAVGIVVAGIVSTILYCCCCRKGGHDDDDGYTDEESQISSDMSVGNEKKVATSIKREDSTKSLFKLFSNEKDGVNRSSSRKKLMNRRSGSGGSGDSLDNVIMFPINEVDTRMDPHTMFLNHTYSRNTLDDEVDYSRKLKVVNPEQGSITPRGPI
ncbi:uncharacterized protein J8A68_005301 [[Candida] subhashii]|uniref:WSC domain-containing protein n=1 Tax=[Candida] subhashii TaxID=561895 RepID=A0A8J5UJI1_9ASCO|nr:uncharacterized protein J8A68_005301 [[Candida] subhashii]KAG7661186.1 hypothetical protein J8A68_005301 [[Candida] subhashii]